MLKRIFHIVFHFSLGKLKLGKTKQVYTQLSLPFYPLPPSLFPPSFKHVAIFLLVANRKCFSGNLISKSVLPANKWDYVLPKVQNTNVSCPAIPLPSLSLWLFLPARGNRGIKKCKKLYIKAGKVEGNVDEAAVLCCCCCPGQVSLHVIWNYYIAHTLIQTHYVCMYTGWAAPDMQHIPLRASSAKWRSFVAKSKSKNEVCNKRRGGEGKKLWNFVRTLPEKNYIDIWFMCS